jgi:hypothetical protein
VEKVFQKSKNFGWFSLTAEDHANMGNPLSRNNELNNNPGKAQYEVMTEQEIERTLDGALENATTADQSLIDNGNAQLQKDFFIKSLAFLKSVGRLPKKYENFDISSLPELHLSKTIQI